MTLVKFLDTFMLLNMKKQGFQCDYFTFTENLGKMCRKGWREKGKTQERGGRRRLWTAGWLEFLKKSNNLDVRGRLWSNNGEEQERKGGNGVLFSDQRNSCFTYPPFDPENCMWSCDKEQSSGTLVNEVCVNMRAKCVCVVPQYPASQLL